MKKGIKKLTAILLAMMMGLSFTYTSYPVYAQENIETKGATSEQTESSVARVNVYDPSTALAKEEVTYTEGLCEHHPEHTLECGYVEVQPCTYDCTQCSDSEQAEDKIEESKSGLEEPSVVPDGSEEVYTDFLAFVPSADTMEAISGTGYSYDSDTKTLTITEQIGNTKWRDDVSIDKTKIETVKLSDQIKIINSPAFEGCSSLKSINLQNVEMINLSAFEGCSSLESISLPEATTISASAFKGCSKLKSISLPKVNIMGTSVFEECSSLESISLPNVDLINVSVFKGCSSLKSISLPKVFLINGWAFEGCSSLESISLPEATTINTSAFKGCSSLKSISMPKATHIQATAFEGCSSLESIYMGKTAPLLIGNLFDKVPSTMMIHVPKDATGYDASVWPTDRTIKGVALSSISVNAGTISFKPNTLEYEFTVPNETSYIQVTPTAYAPDKVKITVNSSLNVVTSGTASGEITLVAGQETTIPIVVTSKEDSEDTKTYIIKVTRQAVTYTYPFLSGMDGTYTKNEDGSYTIKIDADFSKFKSVYIDENLVSNDRYKAESGSTIITFKKEYMNSLKVGEHTITVNFTDGTATTSLTVTDKKYDLEIPSDFKFDTKHEGYETVSANGFQISNMGNLDVTNINAALTGTNADAFILETTGMQNTLAPGAGTSFTIKPKNDLGAGTYTAQVQVTGETGVFKSFEVSFTVEGHTYKDTWVKDETGHWHECDCNAKADEETHTFKWVVDKEATDKEKGLKHEECTVCGYKKASVEIPVLTPTNPEKPNTDKPNKPTVPNTSVNDKTPETGDQTNLGLFTSLLTVSALGIAVLAVLKKKKTLENK